MYRYPADHELDASHGYEPFTTTCRSCNQVHPAGKPHECHPREHEHGWQDERPHPLMRVTVYAVLAILGAAGTGVILSYAARLL